MLDSYSSRPRINIPRTGTDIAIDLAGLALLIGMFVIVGVNYASLPESIPTHFNTAGAPDGFGPRSMIWVLTGVGAAVHALLFAVAFLKPWYYNIPIKITEANAEAAYRLTRRLVQIVRLETTALFGALAYFTIQVAMGGRAGLGLWLLPTCVGSILLTVFAFVAFLSRVREKPGSAARAGA